MLVLRSAEQRQLDVIVRVIIDFLIFPYLADAGDRAFAQPKNDRHRVGVGNVRAGALSAFSGPLRLTVFVGGKIIVVDDVSADTCSAQQFHDRRPVFSRIDLEVAYLICSCDGIMSTTKQSHYSVPPLYL